MSKGYNKKIPPIVSDSDKLETPAPVPVRISITMLKIVDIEEVKHSIEMQFELEMEWFESRALYNNLKVNSAMNVLAIEDVDSLWLPLVTYANTDQKETTVS